MKRRKDKNGKKRETRRAWQSIGVEEKEKTYCYKENKI